MGISHYLAMTAEEIASADTLPESLAYMACHFSPYGTGLTGLPEMLPKGAMLILNDRIPFRAHEKGLIAKQLQQCVATLGCGCLLLDFQRSDTPKALGKYLAQALPCPVGIAEDFAENTDCAVFLPPVPPDVTLTDYLKPWTGRKIWLEAEPEALKITVDSQGSRSSYLSPEEAGQWNFTDDALHCCYRAEVFPDRAEFTLQRTQEALRQLLGEAEALGVSTAVSLYQQMKKLPAG